MLLLTTPELTALRAARTFLQAAREQNYPHDKLRLVVNRADLIGGVPLKEIERSLRLRSAQLADDSGLVTFSINRGVPLVTSHPRKPLARHRPPGRRPGRRGRAARARREGPAAAAVEEASAVPWLPLPPCRPRCRRPRQLGRRRLPGGCRRPPEAVAPQDGALGLERHVFVTLLRRRAAGPALGLRRHLGTAAWPRGGRPSCSSPSSTSSTGWCSTACFWRWRAAPSSPAPPGAWSAGAVALPRRRRGRLRHVPAGGLLGRGAMGMGDVKLAAAIGLTVGYPAVLSALFLGIVFGGIAAAIVILQGKGRRATIAYAPWLSLGAVYVMLDRRPANGCVSEVVLVQRLG